MDISLQGGLSNLEKQELTQDNERGSLNGFIRNELRYVDARELQPVVRNVTSQREHFVPQRCEPQRTSLRASFLKAARNVTGFLRKRFKGVIIAVLAVIIITSGGQRLFQYVKEENLSAEYECNRTLVDSEHPQLVDVLKEFVNGSISDEKFKSVITKMMEKSIPIGESFFKTLTTPDVFRTLPNASQYERVVNAVTFLNNTLLKHQQSGMKEFFDYVTPSCSLNPTRSETITAGGKFLEKATEHLNRTVEKSTHWKHIVPHHVTEGSKFQEQTTWKHIVPHHAIEEQTTWNTSFHITQLQVMDLENRQLGNTSFHIMQLNIINSKKRRLGNTSSLLMQLNMMPYKNRPLGNTSFVLMQLNIMDFKNRPLGYTSPLLVELQVKSLKKRRLGNTSFHIMEVKIRNSKNRRLENTSSLVVERKLMNFKKRLLGNTSSLVVELKVMNFNNRPLGNTSSLLMRRKIKNFKNRLLGNISSLVFALKIVNSENRLLGNTSSLVLVLKTLNFKERPLGNTSSLIMELEAVNSRKI